MKTVELRRGPPECDQPDKTVLREHHVDDGRNLSSIDKRAEPPAIEVNEVDPLDTEVVPGALGQFNRDFPQNCCAAQCRSRSRRSGTPHRLSVPSVSPSG